MTRITINDIPEDRKISAEELRTVMGGSLIQTGLFETGQVINPVNPVNVGVCCCCVFRDIPSLRNLTK